MDTLKKLLLYLLMLVGFYVLSDFLIFMGLNSTYSDIQPRTEVSQQVEINKAEATLVNGRISGTIKNNKNNNLNGKYLRLDLYSERGVLLGTKYLEISNLEPEGQEEFETYFKAEGVEYYTATITDKYEGSTSDLLDVFMDHKMKQTVVLSLLILLYLW